MRKRRRLSARPPGGHLPPESYLTIIGEDMKAYESLGPLTRAAVRNTNYPWPAGAVKRMTAGLLDKVAAEIVREEDAKIRRAREARQAQRLTK